MSDPLQISTQHLRAAFEAALTRLTEQEGENITLERDYFWSVPPNELYNVYEQPQELTIGQLSESWQNIQKLTEDTSAAIPQHLIWIADILRALGHSKTRKPLTQ
ncbi:hypothetical protein FPZ12_027595 [Amycolatopsis acidicola]|uniref:Uncharacterized protein n=1 Tax=Amycolatopsis acidicola TaxID=2596893 RepID=A0A5N0UY59_9PSEU|nr:hypothetical protein [Amycolatopsis acidicola]KAA9156454.1 hypothetical protein FPZ12_027595 [Amycolatopsis acidicola]